jgi:hypothetical protein
MNRLPYLYVDFVWAPDEGPEVHTAAPESGEPHGSAGGPPSPATERSLGVRPPERARSASPSVAAF